MTERTGVHGGDSRPRTIPVVILMMTLVVGMGVGAALVHAYDPRIDEAVQALQKAAALAEAASPGTVSPRTQSSTATSTGPSQRSKRPWATSLPPGLRRTQTAADEAAR
jgi:hypothetical protein